MNDIYENIEEYNQNKQRKILIIFDYMNADILSNKNLNPTVTEVFIGDIKLIHNIILFYQKMLD